MEMLDDITAEKDRISFVLVYKLSRFGRNAADVLKSMQLLMDYDVDLVCVEDSIDSSTQGERLHWRSFQRWRRLSARTSMSGS